MNDQKIAAKGLNAVVNAFLLRSEPDDAIRLRRESKVFRRQEEDLTEELKACRRELSDRKHAYLPPRPTSAADEPIVPHGTCDGCCQFGSVSPDDCRKYSGCPYG